MKKTLFMFAIAPLFVSGCGALVEMAEFPMASTLNFIGEPLDETDRDEEAGLGENGRDPDPGDPAPDPAPADPHDHDNDDREDRDDDREDD